MLDAVLSLFADNAVNVLTEGTHFGRFGSGHPDLVPYQAFPASDGYFIVACLTNAFFKRLCVALGREDWLNDPRYATNPARVERRAEVVGILSEIFKQNTCAALDRAAREARHSELQGHATARDPRPPADRRERASSTRHEDPVRGKIVTLGPPVQMSATPTAHDRVAPMLGEHTDEVLREFGLSESEIAGPARRQRDRLDRPLGPRAARPPCSASVRQRGASGRAARGPGVASSLAHPNSAGSRTHESFSCPAQQCLLVRHPSG